MTLTKRIVDRVKELKEQVEDHATIMKAVKIDTVKGFKVFSEESQEKLKKTIIIDEYTKLLNDEV